MKKEVRSFFCRFARVFIITNTPSSFIFVLDLIDLCVGSVCRRGSWWSVCVCVYLFGYFLPVLRLDLHVPHFFHVSLFLPIFFTLCQPVSLGSAPLFRNRVRLLKTGAAIKLGSE